MNRMSTIELHRAAKHRRAAGPAQPARAPASDDKAMLKAAADLTRDLNVARPAIYWADMIGSALLGYAGAVRGHASSVRPLVAIAAGDRRGPGALPRGQLHS